MVIQDDYDVFELINEDEFDINQHQTFTEAYQDTTVKPDYKSLKTDTETMYGTPPASYVGYIEESSDLWNEVNAASLETNIDPNLLYTIGMQEGFASRYFWDREEDQNYLEKVKHWWTGDDFHSGKLSLTESYEGKQWVDTYRDVGLDIFFNEQSKFLQQGYLDEEIIPDFTYKTFNEANLEVEIGNISKQDAWRATGALIRQNQDWMINSFGNRGVEWDSLSPQEQTFWTYASFNGGPGLAMKLYENYGSMDAIIEYRKSHHNMLTEKGIGALNYYEDPENKGELDHIHYIDNVLRVVGGESLIDFYDPWSYEDF